MKLAETIVFGAVAGFVGPAAIILGTSALVIWMLAALGVYGLLWTVIAWVSASLLGAALAVTLR